MSNRKIPQNLQNPIDNTLIDIVEQLNPYFKKHKFTPNMITSLSLIFGLISNISYLKNKYYISALSLFISYFFDCMDGNYARKYNMQSKFGDYYDHFKDWFIIIILSYLFIKKNKSYIFKKYTFIILGIILLGTNLHVGCSQKYIKKNKSDILESNLSCVTYCPDVKYMNITKYFGTGTFNLVLVLIIILHKYKN